MVVRTYTKIHQTVHLKPERFTICYVFTHKKEIKQANNNSNKPAHSPTKA